MKKTLTILIAACSFAQCAAAQDVGKPGVADAQAHNMAIGKALAMATPIKAAVEDFYRHSARFPASNSELGLNPATSYRNYDVKQIAIGADGAIDITLSASSGVDDGVIRLTPKPSPIKDEHSVEWVCASASYSTIGDATGGVCGYTNQP